ncbi:ADP-ribosylation factor-like protein 16 [Pectinophora gossypiella]|uniref:ADP-ribosylation factor-like protein 16 n=1 Tax=Pectinophora gossypiella TaxID=13191 RepID=UPI00214E8277|nr:ADP-ribosylation factor-like protein 16 [Pectinophora gossypiella]
MDESEKKISILCLGPKGSGKTTLLKKLQDKEGIDYTYSPVPTIGTNIFDIDYVNKNGKKQTVTVREVGGEMAPLWGNYLDGVEKIIFVVDTSNLCQISAAAVMLYTLLAEPRLKYAKFILVLSKMDAAYRQMRNEALLLLQYKRLSAELPNAPILLEAAPLKGEGLDALKTCIAESKPIKPKMIHQIQ